MSCDREVAARSHGVREDPGPDVVAVRERDHPHRSSVPARLPTIPQMDERPIGVQICYDAEFPELSRRLVDVQETERRQISRELHDHMGQHLPALALGVQAWLLLETTLRLGHMYVFAVALLLSLVFMGFAGMA